MMKLLMEDVRLAIRQMLRSSEMVTTVLPMVVLGIALNVVVLHVVDSVRVEMGGQQAARAASVKDRSVQHVFAPVLKMMGSSERRGCAVKGWVKEQQAQAVRYSAEAKQMVYCALGQKSMC